MLAMWMAYVVLVSVLLGLAALAAEKALGYHRRPVRWVWIGALAGSVVLPAAALVAPGLSRPLTSPVVSALPGLAIGPWTEAASATGTGPGLAVWLGAAWLVSVVLLSIHLGASYLRLRSEMGTWRPRTVLGSPVLLSERRGPAVVGFLRSAIVIPNWALELDDALLRAVFRHEHEHVRAGDHRLFGLGIALLLLTPWNPITWWLLSRLRLAIEFDCDRRVLAGGVAARKYVDALMAVGARTTRGWLPTAAFADRPTGVERRLRRIMAPVGRLRMPRTVSAATVAALAIILVLGAPPPASGPASADGLPEDASRWLPPPRAEAGAGDRPSFIPYDLPPELRNRSDVVDALSRAYPTTVGGDDAGGRVELWLYVDENGDVGRFVTKTSSGDARFDAAAKEVAPTMKFRPAINRDRPTAVWVSQWLTFTPARRPFSQAERR